MVTKLAKLDSKVIKALQSQIDLGHPKDGAMIIEDERLSRLVHKSMLESPPECPDCKVTRKDSRPGNFTVFIPCKRHK